MKKIFSYSIDEPDSWHGSHEQEQEMLSNEHEQNNEALLQQTNPKPTDGEKRSAVVSLEKEVEGRGMDKQVQGVEEFLYDLDGAVFDDLAAYIVSKIGGNKNMSVADMDMMMVFESDWVHMDEVSYRFVVDVYGLNKQEEMALAKAVLKIRPNLMVYKDF